MPINAIKTAAVVGSGNYANKPGPKKPHSGMFKKGYDPRRNLAGQPRKTTDMKDLERLCRENASEAFDALIDLVNNPKTPPNTRLAAINSMLDRGFGKPVDRQQILSMSGTIDSESVRLTDEQLLRIAAGAVGQEVEFPREIKQIRRAEEVEAPPQTI
jgi:hypothetical protein